MKKIMKKVLSLMLALVMVLSLAPMTAVAADDPLLRTDGLSEMLNLLQEGTVWRDFEPTEDGTLEIEFESVSGPVALTVNNYTDYSQPIRAQVSTGDTYTLEYVAGNSYEFTFEMAAASADVCALAYKVTLGAGESDSENPGSTPVGGTSLETAIDLTANKTINISANGKTYYTVGMLDNTKTYNVTVTNNTVGPMAGAQQIGVTPYYNGVAEETQYGYGEVTAVVKPGMTGAIYFSVANIFEYGDLGATVTVAEVTEGGDDEGDDTPVSTVGTYDDPAEISFEEKNEVVVKDWNYYWYEYTATEAGRILVTVDENATGWTFDVYNNGEYLYYVSAGSDDVIVKEGETILLCFSHATGNGTYSFDAKFEAGSFEKAPNGTEIYPYPMVMGSNSVELEAGADMWYKYVATQDGTLTLTMKTDESTNGWFYDGYVNEYDSTYFPANTETYFGNSSTNTNPASLRTVPVKAGDVVKFLVKTAMDTTTYEYPAGTVVFNAWFTAGEVADSDKKEEYVVSDEVLVLGENTVELDPSAETTIFEFTPEEAGVYVFTTDNGVLGYWGGGAFFVTDQTENKTATLEYNLENVGPSIMVGVTGEGEATVTVKKAGEAETKPVIPTIIYENMVAPEYSDEFEVILTNVVNINDDVKDQAILGEDGYYHLNAEDGPVLFVDLDGTTISLVQAYGYGRLNGVIVDEDDNTIAIVDFNTAFAEYYSAANDSACYPLTYDLAMILQAVGANEGWYEENGFVGGKYPEHDAWMFACYYDEDITSLETEVEEVEDDGKMEVEIKGESSKVTAESFETIIALNEETAVVLEVESGDEVVTFEFAAGSLTLVDGKETYDFSVELVDDYTEATEDKADIEKDDFVLRVNFSYEGKLPATATISIPVGTTYASKTLYYYQIQADGTLKYVCDAKVDANGIAKVTQSSCSDYVLLAEKVAEPIIPGGTGDATNIALWIAVLGLGVVAIAGSVVMRKREF